MPKAELRAYFDWFMRVMPDRVGDLERYVRETPALAGWVADFSPTSLETLGSWFASQVETRKRTPDEHAEIRERLVFPVDVSGVELTNKTFSLTFDVGFYFALVILKQFPHTRWDHPLKNPKYIDYGEPVLVGSGKVPLNPVSVVVTLAYGISRGKHHGGRLRELYDNWVKVLWP
jgi:hypothetical protein